MMDAVNVQNAAHRNADKMITLICDRCGSEDIEFTATGVWNTHEQDYQWEMTEAFCHKCNDIVPVEEVTIKRRNRRKNENVGD